jgi:F0F1-type ATP synthase epsilon subunit
MKSFRLVVVTDTKTLFSGEALYCSVTTPSGSMGFEADHEPFLCTLQPGSVIQIKDASAKETEAASGIESGFLSFKDNICRITVLLQNAG